MPEPRMLLLAREACVCYMGHCLPKGSETIAVVAELVDAQR